MKSRTQYTVLNSVTSLSIQPFKVLMGFLSRSVFIATLGLTYLSLSGLLTSILSVLSLAELGVGAAMTYSLYKPLADEDHPKVAAYMQLFQKLYRYIGLAILILGTILSFFLSHFMRGQEVTSEVIIIYFLFLINSVVSYFFVYKRTLIEADQQKYKIMILDFLVFLIGNLIQIALLLLTKNYYLYLLCTILMTLVGNFLVSHVVDREYPYILESEVSEISQSEKQVFIKNIKGLVVSKLGDTVVFGTDNILMSTFIGLSVVGLYSNYTYLIGIVTGFMIMFVNAVRSSIANLVHNAQSSTERVLDFFKTYQFLLFMLVFFMSLGIFLFINPIITIWLGESYVFDINILLVIALNCFITTYRQIFSLFISIYGLNYEQNLKTIIEAVLNIVFSLGLLYFTDLGIVAVLGGTILSSLATVVWYEPYSVFKYGIKASGMFVYKTMAVHYFTMLAGFACVYLVEVQYLQGLGLLTDLAWRALLYLFIFLLFTLVTYKHPGSIFVRQLTARFLKIKKK